jgi:hypothetical protein
MWIFNTIKYKIIENFVFSLWYVKKSQEWSHIKFEINWKILIIPEHKEISRWTLNNIFKIISFHFNFDKKEIEIQFLDFMKK